MSTIGANRSAPATAPALRERWREQGFVLLPNFFTEDEIARLRELVDRYVEDSAGVTASNDVYDLDPQHTASKPRVRRIKNPDTLDQLFRGFARDARIVEVLQDLLGTGIRLEVGKVNLKPPGGDGAIHWHQDYPFSPLTNDDSAAVGIFIDDVTEQNGPLLVVPGSHREPLCDHHRAGRFVGRVDAERSAAAENAAVALTGPAGSITIHHCRTLHSSDVNRSDRTRRIYFNQYHAADAWPLLGVPDLEWWGERLLAGRECYRPRITMTDVKLPLPRQPYGSIFEVQAAVNESSKR